MRKVPFLLLTLALITGACSRNAPVKNGSTPVATIAGTVAPRLANPTSISIQTYLPPTRAPGEPIASPTANQGAEVIAFPTFTPLAAPTQIGAPTKPAGSEYTVQSGDYPSSIAQQFGITTEELLAANNQNDAWIMYPGDVILVPVTGRPIGAGIGPNEPASASAYFKIIPDSELVYGPLSTSLDVQEFVRQQGGYLAKYSEVVDGDTLDGAQIVELVAKRFSVNPRLLLAVLEYRSGWVTNANPDQSRLETPIGYVDTYYINLYHQLTWSADMLNQGFYRFHEGKVKTWRLADGSLVEPHPGINPGTAGVQNLFAALDKADTWPVDTGPDGLHALITRMFGYPFDLAIEPVLPPELIQPVLSLPFGPGEAWQFTGGPHGGWVSGSAWAALDFAPPGEPIGCGSSDNWVTAVTAGKVIRVEHGAVVQDLDNDGLEQTGWTILYMHISPTDRVQIGAMLQPGDKIGHPSCEGGAALATHLHIARRYNGVWINAADPNLPFVMDGYKASGSEVEYDGKLTGHGKVIEAWDGINPVNIIQR